MGDRGNIAIKQDDGSHIFFYTHWGGSYIASDVQRALSKQWRWDDPAYLARIIFDEMTENVRGEETGFGISNGISDNEHNIVEVDGRHRMVRILADGLEVLRTFTFEEFVSLDPNLIDGLV